jgi:hypothetical protein
MPNDVSRRWWLVPNDDMVHTGMSNNPRVSKDIWMMRLDILIYLMYSLK